MSLVRINRINRTTAMAATLPSSSVASPSTSSPQLPLISLCETVAKINMPSVVQANMSNNLKPIAPTTSGVSGSSEAVFNLTISNGEPHPSTCNSVPHLGVAAFSVPNNLKEVVSTTAQKPIIVTVSSMPGIAGGKQVSLKYTKKEVVIVDGTKKAVYLCGTGNKVQDYKQLTSVTNVLTSPLLSTPVHMIASHFSGDKLPSTTSLVNVPSVSRAGSTLLQVSPAVQTKPRSSTPHLAPLLSGNIIASKGVTQVPVMIANAGSSLFSSPVTSGGTTMGTISLPSSIVTVTPVLMTSTAPLVSLPGNSGVTLSHCTVSQAQVLTPVLQSTVKSLVSSNAKNIVPAFLKPFAIPTTNSFPVGGQQLTLAPQNGPAMSATNPKSDPTNPDYDPIQAMEWKDGIASLPGSNIKFKLNEFGTLEIVTEDFEMTNATESLQVEAPSTISDEVKNNVENANIVSNDIKESPKDESTVASKLESGNANVKEDNSEDICCCENCNCYGMKMEFCKSGRFCSQACVAIYANKKNALMKRGSKKEGGKKKKRKLSSQSDSNEELNDKEIKHEVFEVEVEKMEGIEDVEEFSWEHYLSDENAVAASANSFNSYQSIPTQKNGFQVNMKLEGIDPKHPSLFCMLTVSEIRGYRIRLHFDGYSECYDFWTNANSLDIFPVGWCEKTNHKLQAPKGFTSKDFSWNSYLKLSQSIAAPEHLFSCTSLEPQPMLGFRLGMKLEAVDKKNSSLVCVATVTDVMEDRFLIHFDGWEDIYDYWAEPTSPHIHPVNWCRENGHVLTPPKDCKDPDSFSWDKYIGETKAVPVPHRAFKQRPRHGFEKGMKLEAVDKRNPVLVRVATIVDTTEHSLLIHFDGWSNAYDYWVDDDSPDIHPINWCSSTGYLLEPPVDMESDSPGQGGCPTPGCHGVGHIKGPKYTTHHSAFGCPYSQMNINKLENTLQDRIVLSKEAIAEMTRKLTEQVGTTEGLRRCPTPGCSGLGHVKGKYSVHHRVSGCPIAEKNAIKAQQESSSPAPVSVNNLSNPVPCTSTSVTPPSYDSDSKSLDSLRSRNGFGRGKKRTKLAGTGMRGRPPKALVLLRAQQAAEKNQATDSSPDSKSAAPLQQIHKSGFDSSHVNPPSDFPQHWEDHVKLLPGVSTVKGNTVKNWSVENVVNFVASLKGCEEHTSLFYEEQIDGEAFLLLNQMDIVNILRIKLGPALKIYNSILSFKSTENE